MTDPTTVLREALVRAAIPLEVLNMDNYIGAKWMAPELREAVAEAVVAIRAALSSDPVVGAGEGER